MLRILFVLSIFLTSSTNVFAKNVHITLLQANDVYEMSPVNGGRYGGLARVETVKKNLTKRNRNTYSILAGDLISPSAIGTAKVGGKRLDGEQMIAVLNAMQWDYFTLGNHEFDNGYNALIERLQEAKFTTVSSNVLDAKTGKPFINTVQTDVLTVQGVKIGIAGIALESLSKDFVTIQDPFDTARNVVETLRKQNEVDIVVLITHQDFADDVAFAENIEGIDLIIGGHEHENIYARRGSDLVPIAKADANARSVYIHDLFFDTRSKELNIESRLQIIDDAIKEDKDIKVVVDGWVNRAYDAFRKEGFEPEQVVCTTTESLDGLEASVRNGSTRLTELVAESALTGLPGSQASVYNSGSIRIDDVLPPGEVTQYDVIRILPFSGTTFEQVSMPGDLLKKALNVGMKSRGTGAYLQYANIDYQDGQWRLLGNVISDSSSYTLAISSFLVNSGDTGLEFLVNNPRIKKVPGAKEDARRALIKQLKASWPDSGDT